MRCTLLPPIFTQITPECALNKLFSTPHNETAEMLLESRIEFESCQSTKRVPLGHYDGLMSLHFQNIECRYSMYALEL